MQVGLDELTVSIGDRLILDRVSATFSSGVISAIVGPSGSGKSTLLSVIAGIRRPRSGQVRYEDFGGDSSQVPRVAWVPQGSNALGRRTVIDNVAVGALSSGFSRPEAADRALELLAQVGLEDRSQAQAKDLSGGELQRVGFARALASDAMIILADEPSASLDAANTLRIAELLASLRVSVVVVLATHDPLLVASAGHVFDLRARPHG